MNRFLEKIGDIVFNVLYKYYLITWFIIFLIVCYGLTEFILWAVK